MDDHRWIADSLYRMADCRADHAFRREQAHLRVIGNGTDSPVSRSKIANAARTEAAADLGDIHELDRSTKRVANCTAQQASPTAVYDG